MQRYLLLLSLVLGLSPAGTAAAEQQHYSPGPVLGADGLPATQGWAPQEALRFDPMHALDAKRLRRWDYFAVTNEHVVLEFTLADIGFTRFCSVGVMDFRTGKSKMGIALPLHASDQLVLSKTSKGTTVCKMGGDVVTFETLADRRILTVDIKGGLISAAVKGRLVLLQPLAHEYLSLVMPFEEGAGAFFYENKVPALPAEGAVSFDGKTYTFDPKNSFGIMDWGRGVWPMHTFWHWGGGAGYVDGVPVGFNLGYGFGVTTAATENVLVVGGRAHKLARVNWAFDRDDLMRPWTFTSDGARFEMKFYPVQIQQVDVNVLVKAVKLDKVYGYYKGTITLDDGKVIKVDKMFGFAEEVTIDW